MAIPSLEVPSRGVPVNRWSILTWATAASWLTVAALWWLHVLQQPAPTWVSQVMAVVAISLTGVLIVARGLAAWRRGERRRILILFAIVVLSLALHVIGIEHEVGDGYYHDEGTYRHHAYQINQGNYLRDSFFYPHLLYYIDAFVTWLAALAPQPVLAASTWVFGVSDWQVFCRLLARLVTAVMAGLTAVPVFRAAERLWGLYAGALAGLLIACAPVYNQGGHLNTADVPSAFFAALSFQVVARLVQAESRRDYVWAGIYAGLAAGTKYPAGLVALAIVAVYLKWRLADRRFSWGLVWAGLPSLAVFLLTTPGLALDPRSNIFGSKGALFGARQYSQGGWIGVVVDSNWLYYLNLIAQSFAWPAILLGVTGLFLLRRQPLRSALWLLPFPALYLALISSMNMVVERNLYPALPALAVLLGAGIAAWARRCRERLPSKGGLLALGLAVVCLNLPFLRVVMQDIAYTSDSTRQVAAAWARETLPRGAKILKERYTPNLDLSAFQVEKTRWIGAYTVAELVEADFDFVMLASDAFQRFLRPELHFKDFHKIAEGNYRQIFELEQVTEIRPSNLRMGPRILAFKVPPRDVPERQVIDARKPIRKKLEPREEWTARVRWVQTHHWRTLRATLRAGSNRLQLNGAIAGYGYLGVIDLDNQEVTYAERAEGEAFRITLEQGGRFLLCFYIDQASQLETLEISPIPADR